MNRTEPSSEDARPVDPSAPGGDRSREAGEGKASEAAGSAGAARRQAENGPDLDRDRYHRFDHGDAKDLRRDRQRDEADGDSPVGMPREEQ